MMKRATATALMVCALTVMTTAQSTGPDIIVGDLVGTANYGQVGGISAFSVGTTSCNIGNVPANWIAGNNQHPVIGQNLYRLKNGRMEQIGMSWLKHGFLALAGNVCSTCQNPGTGALLGVGCSDPYSASLNGQQSGLGPRSEINAFTGGYPYPFSSPTIPPTIGRRLQVKNIDIDPAQNVGALYFVEGHYVTLDDAQAGNQFNNASYRAVTFTPSGSNFNMAFGAGSSTQQQKQAIQAWKDVDPSVILQTINVPGDGRLMLAMKATALTGGMVNYEYALYNMNCDRSVQGFAVNMGTGATIANVGFHDVDYHSGDGIVVGTTYSGTDWPMTQTGSSLSWSTQTFAQSTNANALRWGSTYNFRFDSDTFPGDITITLYKPGTPTTLTVPSPFAPFTLNVPTIPATIAPMVTSTVSVVATNGLSSPSPTSGQLFYSINGGPMIASPMTFTGSNTFQGTLPATACFSTIDWYVSLASTAGNGVVRAPAGAPASTFRSTSGVVLLQDDFQTNLGWLVGNSPSLTTGAWQRGIPAGGGVRGEPEADADGSGQCYVTGNTAGDFDVDGGSTVLTSPIVNLAPWSSARVQMQIWHDNGFGGTPQPTDDLRIEFTSDGVNWVPVETIAAPTMGWVARTYDPASYVAFTSIFQVRVISSDLGVESIVESGLDGFRILGCPQGPSLTACADGNVGVTQGGPYPVLFVNGSPGNVNYRVDVGLNQAINISTFNPPTMPFPASFAIFGAIGAPTPANVYNVPGSIGQMCFPPCATAPLNPFLFLLTSSLGPIPGCTQFLGSNPGNWSFTFNLGVPFALQFALQGVVQDISAPTGYAVTNGVLVNIL